MTKQSIQNHCLKNGLPRYARNDGFTLAEVLITLVIIGVIAAITVPTLITKYQKEQTVTRLKKAYSTLSQTTQRAIADNGPLATWEIGDNGSGESAKQFFQKYLKPYLSISKDCGIDTSGTCNFQYSYLNNDATTKSFGSELCRFYLQDGTFIALRTTKESENSEQIQLYIDINGQKSPNKFGRDIFWYVYYIKNEESSVVGKFLPGNAHWTREKIVNERCTKNATSYAGFNCAALIMKDSWQIKDDYPW